MSVSKEASKQASGWERARASAHALTRTSKQASRQNRESQRKKYMCIHTHTKWDSLHTCDRESRNRIFRTREASPYQYLLIWQVALYFRRCSSLRLCVLFMPPVASASSFCKMLFYYSVTRYSYAFSLSLSLSPCLSLCTLFVYIVRRISHWNSMQTCIHCTYISSLRHI